jgi:lipoprotein-anchoring transpeptidase ErfK/SrfK
MAWTMGSRRVVRVLGWLVPALATLITPSALAQNPVDMAHGVEFQGSVQKSDAKLGHPAVDAAPTPIRAKRQVIVSVPDRKLVVMQNGAVLGVFEVAVGADVSPSPSGTFEIVRRLTEPTYYHAGVGLNKKGYGIHGTNAPRSIGKAASHGCIRMRNRDIVQFFAMVSVGDTVEIHGQRDEQVAEIFGGQASEPMEVAQAEASSTGAAAGQ